MYVNMCICIYVCNCMYVMNWCVTKYINLEIVTDNIICYKSINK